MNTKYEDQCGGGCAPTAASVQKKRETQFDNVLSLNSSELDRLEKTLIVLRERLSPVCAQPAPSATPDLANRLCRREDSPGVAQVAFVPLADTIRQRNVRLGEINEGFQRLLSSIEL